MESVTLQWPGLWDIPVYVFDRESNKVYGKGNPLPPHKAHLDSATNHCVRLSAVLGLFTDAVRHEAEWTLRNLLGNYNIGDVIHATVIKKETSEDSSEEVHREITTYIPSVTLMTFAIIWPHCKAFQSMKKAVLSLLSNYADSVCINCGFTNQDCRCTNKEDTTSSPLISYLSHASTMQDSSVQTEPLVLLNTSPHVNTPNLPMMFPNQFQFTQNLNPTISGGQGLPGMNSVFVPPRFPSAPTIISLAPTIAFPTRGSSVLLNNVTSSTPAGSLRPPTVNPGAVSIICPPLLSGSTVPGMPSIVVCSGTNGAEAESSPGRKRKLDMDTSSVTDIGIQTLAKSFVKKMKVRLGSFSASDFKIVKAIKTTPPDETDLSNELSEERNAALTMMSLSANATVSQSPVLPTNSDTAKKDPKPETVTEKKFATVWKLLEESSDEEETEDCTPTPDDVPTSSESAQPVATNTASDLATVSEQKLDTEQSMETSCCEEHTSKLPDSSIRSSPPVNKNSLAADNDNSDENNLVINESECAENSASEVQTTEHGNEWKNRNGLPGQDSPTEHQNISPTKKETPGTLTPDDKLKNSVVSDEANADHMPDSGADANATSQEENGQKAADVSETPEQKTDGTSKSKVKKIYRKFEYTPTGEHILRCLVPKCCQTFDTRQTADIHSHVHQGFVPDSENAEGMTQFQCHRCEFQAPFYHWYDLLRHMRMKHDINLVDGTAELTCEYCGLGFETKELLISHIDFHYSNRYKCIYCGLLLLTWGQVPNFTALIGRQLAVS